MSGRALLLSALLLVAGCPREQGERTSGAPGPAAPPAGPNLSGSSPAKRFSRLELGALAHEAGELVVAKLLRAHYDPVALGLTELAFELSLSLPRTATEVEATGSWRKGGTPEVVLRRVKRRGELQSRPPDGGLGEQLWTSLRLQLQNLLEGVGRGFLSGRLQGWQQVKGKSSLVGGKLLLSLREETGETLVTIGPGYRVERVENRSPKKVTRSMQYSHRMEGGRNLVTRALLKVVVEQGADVPPKGASMLQSTDGMTFEIDHGEAGVFLLPVKLRRYTPRTGEALTLTIRYTKAR